MSLSTAQYKLTKPAADAIGLETNVHVTNWMILTYWQCN